MSAISAQIMIFTKILDNLKILRISWGRFDTKRLHKFIGSIIRGNIYFENPNDLKNI